MPAISNEEWSNKTLTKGFDGVWRATKTWFVYGADTEDQALTATPDPNGGGAAIPPNNGNHPSSTSLLVRERTASNEGGPTSWKVTVQYSTPTPGNPTQPDPEPDPLARAARIGVQNGEISVPVDRDLDQKKIVNSSGDAFTPERTRTVRVKTINVKYFAPYYDWSLVQTYEDTINNDQFEIGTLTVLPGDARVMGIDLIGDYPIVVPYVEMHIQIAVVLQRLQQNPRFPFWYTYLKDQGRNGWAGTKYGKFVDSSGNELVDPVPLQGDGKPFDTALKVKTDTGNVAPTSAPAGVGPGVTLMTPGGSTNTKVWQFRDYPASSFNNLLATIGHSLSRNRG